MVHPGFYFQFWPGSKRDRAVTQMYTDRYAVTWKIQSRMLRKFSTPQSTSYDVSSKELEDASKGEQPADMR